MNNKEIHSILQDALEKEIPSSEVDLWKDVKATLVSGKTFQQGKKMNRTQPRRISRAAFAGLMIVFLLALAFITPQGRAFAQNILQFFNRADSKTLPLPPDQIASPEDSQSIPTVQAPAPLISVAEAEKIAGFDAKELPSVPQGFEFIGALAADAGISIQYDAQGHGGQLVINEATSGFMQSDWDQAPEDAITQVKIGALDAEVVQGAYVVYPGGTTAEWNPDAPILRLRWIEDGIWFEMAKFGGVESIAYLDQDGLIALAESMVNDP